MDAAAAKTVYLRPTLVTDCSVLFGLQWGKTQISDIVQWQLFVLVRVLNACYEKWSVFGLLPRYLEDNFGSLWLAAVPTSFYVCTLLLTLCYRSVFPIWLTRLTTCLTKCLTWLIFVLKKFLHHLSLREPPSFFEIH